MPLIQTDIAGFREYHKIDTLFERDAQFVVNPSLIKQPVLETISQWDVTEKIDGTNIRVMFSPEGEVSIGGRSNAAQVPADLLKTLAGMFPAAQLASVFHANGTPQVILFGEGYGAGIQKGGCYRQDKSFILFDILVDEKWWMEREQIDDIAASLSCDVVPYLGMMDLDEIVRLVRNGFPSRIGTGQAEGIVARPIQTLFDRRGERVIIKLKQRDFIAGRR